MKMDTETLAQTYADMSAEELGCINPESLTSEAKQIYALELKKRNLTPENLDQFSDTASIKTKETPFILELAGYAAVLLFISWILYNCGKQDINLLPLIFIPIAGALHRKLKKIPADDKQ